MRGLRDIRTLGRLRRSAPARLVLSLLDVQLGFSGRPPRRLAELPPEPPRAWVFVKRPRFARHQGMLLVDRLAEPVVEVFEEEQALVVLVELPGVREEDIDVQVDRDVLILSTRSASEWRRYYRELLLPFSVTPANMRRALRNGVLELELARASTSGAAERNEP